MFSNSDILCSISLSSLHVPMGGHYEVYTSLEQRRMFTYANVRKASYTGSKTMINISIIVSIRMIFQCSSSV